MIAAFGWSDLAYLALAVFLFLAGVAIAYGSVRLGGTLGRVSSLLEAAERDLLPVVAKLGGTVERVNSQLAKVDQITDSAVDAVASVDSAVRAVTSAAARPAGKLAGLVAGLRHGASSMRAGGTVRDAVRTGREEGARRERDLADELGGDE